MIKLFIIILFSSSHLLDALSSCNLLSFENLRSELFEETYSYRNKTITRRGEKDPQLLIQAQKIASNFSQMLDEAGVNVGLIDRMNETFQRRMMGDRQDIVFCESLFIVVEDMVRINRMPTQQIALNLQIARDILDGYGEVSTWVNMISKIKAGRDYLNSGVSNTHPLERIIRLGDFNDQP